ncbi:MAG: hypothetical protein H5U00_08785 [Clostridia bacterium]|nr:hypothetical protein [Clostridia bacterium]
MERNFLVPVPQVSSLEEFNTFLREKCLAYAREHKVPGTAKTVAEVWEEERKALLPLPAKPFACCRTLEVKSDRYSRISFETNRYSVPTSYAGSFLTLRAYVDHLEVWQGKELIALHQRMRPGGRNPRPRALPAGTGKKNRAPGRTPGPSKQKSFRPSTKRPCPH